MDLEEMDERRLDDLQLVFERGGKFDEETFLTVLKEAIGCLEDEEVGYVLMGGLASAALGRPRWTHDIDVFVKPEDAPRALAGLDAAGFRTQQTYPDWLYKALKDDVLVDVIFRSAGDIYLDDEMVAHSKTIDFKGVRVRLIAPEDLIVIKAVVHGEHIPRHWYDALGIMATYELDWDYVLKRARHGAKRTLSLLIYAQSNDLVVPNHVIDSLYEQIYSS